jgi:3'(2'), 5'-bisphosphate nucleotidase
MTQHTDDDLLSLAADLARLAGAAILRVRARGFDVLTKADASPVTEADTAAEAIIVAGLRRATPDIPVIAEEEVAAGRIETGGLEAFWLVDPLDGTREFTAGTDDFTVNVGLIRHGRPVLGAVGVPARGELFCGIVGVGAFKRDAGGERRISARVPPAAGLDVLASRHHANDERLGEFLRGRQVASIGNIGSAVKFLHVAEGKADLYPRFGRTMEWDTAAPQAVLEAAGGSVVRADDGTPLMYGKAGFENPGFVCTGRLAG